MDTTSISPNCVGWNILEGYPWWPAFICDPTKLRPNLHLLGTLALWQWTYRRCLTRRDYTVWRMN